MLIHKATMGVLEYFWTGKYQTNHSGNLVPIDRPATLSDVDDPEEWWEIPNNCTLARTIHIYYPWITPEIDSDGRLIGVKIQKDEEDEPEFHIDRDALKREASSRGYRNIGRIRPKGMMPFLRKEE